MKSSVFRFKQFEVYQDRTAMKIGTDGVLLGAWAAADNPFRILDVGTGTGLIALMLAQRYPEALIEAVEIEAGAAEQAHYNFQISPWKDRLHLVQTDFKDFQTDYRYDLIVSNPPFFDGKYLSDDSNRNWARHNQKLSLEVLLQKSKSLLTEHGSLHLILPVQKEKELYEIAETTGFFLRQITYVKGRHDLPVKRFLVQMVQKPSEIQTNLLAIEIARHRYTKEYVFLTRDFYLKM